jgi:hypothetical protein
MRNQPVDDSAHSPGIDFEFTREPTGFTVEDFLRLGIHRNFRLVLPHHDPSLLPIPAENAVALQPIAVGRSLAFIVEDGP